MDLATVPCTFSTFARADSYSRSFSSSALGHSLFAPDRACDCDCDCDCGGPPGKLATVNLEEFGLLPVALATLGLAGPVPVPVPPATGTEGRAPNSSILEFELVGLCVGRAPKPRPAPYPTSSALPGGKVLDGVVLMGAGGRWMGRVEERGVGSTLIGWWPSDTLRGRRERVGAGPIRLGERC